MNREQIKKELLFRTSRSSGAGGQHVNKVETKVEILFAPSESLAFSDAEKTLLLVNLESKITKEGYIQVTSQEARSQLLNKGIAEKKLFQLLSDALTVPEERKPTAIPKGVLMARKKAKGLRGVLKASRKKVSISTSDDADFLNL